MGRRKTLLTALLLCSSAPVLAGITAPGPLTLTFPDRERIEWNPGPFDRLWNLYRGDLDNLRATATYTPSVRVCGRNASWWNESTPVPPGSASFYLVSPVITVTEHGVGEDSAGDQRLLEAPCSEGYFCVADLFDSFVLKVVDKEDLDHARVVAYGFGEPRVHVSGQVALAPEPWNPGWNFHVVPSTVGYWEYALEVCDAAIAWVDVHGGPAPGGSWCPWWSEILYELPNPDETEPDGIPPRPCGPSISGP